MNIKNTFMQSLMVITIFTGIAYLFGLFLNKKKEIHSDVLLKFFKFSSSIFPTLLFVLIIRSFFLEPFQVSSESMMPTLLEGDFILVNKFLYGIRNPISQKKIFNVRFPERGDILVFRCPFDQKIYYIKRVIGIPGDKIVYNFYNQRLLIYPKYKENQNSHKNSSHIPIIYKKIILFSTKKKQIQKENSSFKLNNIQKKTSKKNLIEYQESFEKKSHKILLLQNDVKILDVNSKEFNFSKKEWIVPENKYFVMGDNRSNSFDSRYWGFVSDIHLVGKTIGIWMSVEKTKNFFPIKFRLERIGKIY